MDLLQASSRQPQHIHHSFFHSFFTKKQLTHYSLFFFFLLVITYIFFFSPSHSLTSLAFFSRILPKSQHFSTTFSSTIDESSKVCDYSNGRWIRDEGYSSRLYTEECPFLDPGFRCQRNGRSDVDYVNWRWQPKDCHLPRDGSWNDGGHCDSNTSPETNYSKLEPETSNNLFVSHVVQQIESQRRKAYFLNITYLSEFRNDGHPSLHREPGTPVDAPQDCSHWCLPGVPDTWNEVIYAHLLSKGFKTKLE